MKSKILGGIYLIACMVVLGVSQAAALAVTTTYDYTLAGSDSDPTSISGTITVTGSSVTDLSIDAGIYGTYDFAGLFGQAPNGSDYELLINNTADSFRLALYLATATTLFDGSGASIDSTLTSIEPLLSSSQCTESNNACVGSITGSLTISQTPLPAALPLFAGGLGLMGLLGRRRKRKVALASD